VDTRKPSDSRLIGIVKGTFKISVAMAHFCQQCAVLIGIVHIAPGGAVYCILDRDNAFRNAILLKIAHIFRSSKLVPQSKGDNYLNNSKLR